MCNRFTRLIVVALAMFMISSCEDDNPTPDPQPVVLEEQTAEDIPADPANTGKFTFYSLSDGEIIASSDSATTKWDIGLKGTTLIVNGGVSGPGQAAAQLVNGLFEEIEEAPESGYTEDSEAGLAIPTGSDNGWYNYTANSSPMHAILPIPGKVILLKTAEGHYAKLEILSYYQGNPDTSTDAFASMDSRPAGKYYTFRYMIQEDGSRTF